MAATTDRARFYLEQYVPELQEFQQKGIFSRDEIASITSKRSDFEHILNARGSTPADYARYATYEMNLDSLRKKRCKRLGVKSTGFSGQRTVFFVLDRATKKFPADMGLWMQYINFCKKEKANKKLVKVLTNVLRLHPRDWSLWVLAAKHYAETQGDMGTARSYMQRGLRFCKDERKMYLEYAKLEMVYLAKLAARKKILGLDGTRTEEKEVDDENFTALPTITVADIEPDTSLGVEEVNEDALKRLESAPAFTGAIPIAIFDAAMKQFTRDGASVAEDFFDLILAFDNVQASRSILQHVLEYLQGATPSSAENIVCQGKLHLFGIPIQSADFPSALSNFLGTIKRGLNAIPEKEKPKLAESATLALLPYLPETEGVSVIEDEDIVRVIRTSIKRYLRVLAEAPIKKGQKGWVHTLSGRLQKEGLSRESAVISQLTGDHDKAVE